MAVPDAIPTPITSQQTSADVEPFSFIIGVDFFSRLIPEFDKTNIIPLRMERADTILSMKKVCEPLANWIQIQPCWKCILDVKNFIIMILIQLCRFYLTDFS